MKLRASGQILLGVCLCFGLGRGLAHGQNLSQNLAAMLQTLGLIQDQALTRPDDLSLMRGAIRGMLKSLNDPYSSYLEPADYAALKAEESGEVVGVGVELDYRDRQVLIMSVLEQTPAARAGLRSGDRILAIDGVETATLSWPDILRRMQGGIGQPLQLRILPAGKSLPVNLSLIRQTLNLSAVGLESLPNDICRLNLRTFFNQNLHQEVEDRLAEGMENCVGGLILDLRNNPGGLISEAIAVAGQLGINGTVVQIVSREGRVEPQDTAVPAVLPESLPMVVLINKGTASAAEVLTAALRENGRAVVLGETSFGKGLVQSLLPLDDGSGLLLTTHRYLTGRGNNLQQVGIQPDLPMADGPELLDKAQAYLQSSQLNAQPF